MDFLGEGMNVLNWPPYSSIEHLWDVLDQRVRQRDPVPENVPQLSVALEEWDNIPWGTIDNLVMSVPCRCTTLHEANGGHPRVLSTLTSDISVSAFVAQGLLPEMSQNCLKFNV